MMYKFLLVGLIFSVTQAANIPITFTATETQIQINYTSTIVGACSLTVVNQNQGPVVLDANASMFTGAASDLTRTSANGFRWPTQINGLNRTVFLGGHDEVKQGLDLRWYSTALQANSDYLITVTCGGDSGIVHVSTANIPMGNNYAEALIPQTGAPLGIPQPTIDWSRGSPGTVQCATAGRNKCYTDAITGVLYKRLTGTNDHIADSEPYALGPFSTTIIDVNSAWTNIANATTNQNPATLATTSTANAILFMPFDVGDNGQNPFNSFARSSGTGGGLVLTDYAFTPYGSAGAGTVTSEWCLSTTSGPCNVFAPIDVNYTTTAGCQPSVTCANDVIPSGAPTNNFSGWGGYTTAFGPYDLTNLQFTGVSASGSTITSASSWFNMGLQAGSKFTLTSCAVGTQVAPLTVSVMNSQLTMTSVESGLALTNCTYTDLHAGLSVAKIGAGTLNVSVTGRGYDGASVSHGSNGGINLCAKTKANYTKDCAGNVTSGQGLLCTTQGGPTIYFIQDNGVTCAQSALYSTGGPGHLSLPTGQTVFWDTTGTTFYASDFAGHIWKGTHIAGDFSEIPVDVTHTLETKFTYTDLGAIEDFHIAAALSAPELGNAFWSDPTLWGWEAAIDDPTYGVIFQFNSATTSSCLKTFMKVDKTFISHNTYGDYPDGYNICHGSPDLLGNGFARISFGAFGGLAPLFYNTSVGIGGPFKANIIGTKKNGSFVQQTRSLTCVAGTTTTCIDNNHNLDPLPANANASQGAYIVITGATGNWAAINGVNYAKLVNANTFNLFSDPQGVVAVNSGTFGAFTGSATYATSKPIYSLGITSVSDSFASTGVHGARLLIATGDPGAGAYFPSLNSLSSVANIIIDADPVTIVLNYMDSTTQYYVKQTCTGCTAAQVDVYSNANLTTQVPYATLSGVAGQHVIYAETCPDPVTVSLPGPMYTDTGFGTAGAPKVRCFTTKLASEFESDFPATNEHTAYPPCTGVGTPTGCVGAASEASNINKSMMHVTHVGDGAGSTDALSQQHELFYALAVDRSLGENQVIVTWERCFADDIPYNSRCVTNGPNVDPYANNHPAGWNLSGSGITGISIMDITTNPPVFYPLPSNPAHSDIGLGIFPNTFTTANTYIAPIVDDKLDATVVQLANNSVTKTQNSTPQFGTSVNYSFNMGQSYPNKRTYVGLTSTSENHWKAEWMAPNGVFGNGQNNQDGGCDPVRSNVSGIIYKIASCNATNNIKVTPVYVNHAPYTFYKDISAHGAVISAHGTKCIAYYSDDCVAGSVRNDIYFADNLIRTDYTFCVANDATWGNPCAMGQWPGMGWAYQINQQPIDINQTGMRRLTQAFTYPWQMWSFTNWTPTTDGKWGIFVNNPIQARPFHLEASGGTGFIMLLPPFPPKSNVVGNNYFPLTINIGKNGDTIRAKFGYAENGDPGDYLNYYCTTRKETCWTTNAPTSADPFLLNDEPQHLYTCGANGCIVVIPAIAGRIIYYNVEVNGVLQGLKTAAIP